MTQSLDDIMERASQALSRMDYLGCEILCLQALTRARAAQNWSYYARILLPLQEARRQRRMIAAEGVIRLGTSALQAPAASWLDQIQEGCIVVTHPHTAQDAAALHDQAREHRLHMEVLFVDNLSREPLWHLRSFTGPEVTCAFAAPPTAWRERWLAAGETPATDAEADATTGDAAPGATPADWFLNAAETLGDEALRANSAADVEILEPLLSVAPDHEILHQRLAAAARARQSRGEGAGR